jgi:AcrR family transcriptional regulator
MNGRSEMGIKGKLTVKDQILKAARDIFSNKGYKATTMKEIALASNVGVGSLYLHFTDKREIYISLIKEQAKKFNEYIRMYENLEPIQALEGIFDCYLEYSIKNTKLISVNLTEGVYEAKEIFVKYFHKPQEELINSIIIRGIDANVFKEIDIEKFSKLIISLLTGLVTFYIRGEITDLKAYGNILLSLLLNGLRRIDQ